MGTRIEWADILCTKEPGAQVPMTAIRAAQEARR
jgi:hypothetical protein